jgi:hypothetical protein
MKRTERPRVSPAMVVAALALVLPPELRPGFNHSFAAVCDADGIQFDPRPGIVDVSVDGSVIPVSNPPATDYNCTERLSLDGISFRAGG